MELKRKVQNLQQYRLSWHCQFLYVGGLASLGIANLSTQVDQLVLALPISLHREKKNGIEKTGSKSAAISPVVALPISLRSGGKMLVLLRSVQLSSGCPSSPISLEHLCTCVTPDARGYLAWILLGITLFPSIIFKVQVAPLLVVGPEL